MLLNRKLVLSYVYGLVIECNAIATYFKNTLMSRMSMHPFRHKTTRVYSSSINGATFDYRKQDCSPAMSDQRPRRNTAEP